MVTCLICKIEITESDETTTLVAGENEYQLHESCFKIKDAQINAEIRKEMPRPW
jgi:hypothetical protein